MSPLAHIPVVHLRVDLPPEQVEAELQELDFHLSSPEWPGRLLIDADRSLHPSITRGVRVMLDAPDMKSPNRFRRLGECWIICFQGKESAFRDTFGFIYIHFLLQHPRKDVPADELKALLLPGIKPWNSSADSRRVDDSGPLIDRRGATQVLARVDQLDDQIGRAEAFGDLRKVTSLKNEREAYVNHLAKEQGLHGPRRLGSGRDKARQAVWHAIHHAFERIGIEDEDLAIYLRRTITKGHFYRYDPQPGITWQLW